MYPDTLAPPPEAALRRKWIGAMDYFDLVLFYGLMLGGMGYLVYNVCAKFMDGYRDTHSIRRSLLIVRKWESKEARVRKKALENLPQPVKYKIRDEESQETNACAICLEDFTEDELCRVLPKCNHIFHSVCVSPWFTKHQSCPICRTEI